MRELGYNYRITDFQCALGSQQLRKLPSFLQRRQKIAKSYDLAFSDFSAVCPVKTSIGLEHAYHLYVIQFELEQLRADRMEIFKALRAEGIGVNVHYIPVYLHPFYRTRFNTRPGLCPKAEKAYERMISLPVFPGMMEQDVMDVVEAVRKVVMWYLR